MMHQNSLEAHAEERDAGNFLKRTSLILRCLRGWEKRGLSDRQIMETLGLPDRNSVAPRITEAIKQGILEECGDTIDHVTGKRVRLVRLPQEQGKLF